LPFSVNFGALYLGSVLNLFIYLRLNILINTKDNYMLQNLAGSQKQWITGLTIVSLLLGSIVAIKNLNRLRAEEESTSKRLTELEDRVEELES